MDRRILAALSLFGASATALSTAPGQAIVVNNCGYSVNLNNVPAAGQGAEAFSETLAPGDTYSQYWTALTGGDGWSIKLAPSDSTTGQIIQFEYTYSPIVSQFTDIIWFDMSFVNGDPFNNDWRFTSSAADCQSRLKQQAYLFSTDDAHGMQAPCSPSSDITLTICPGNDGSSSSSGGLLGGIASGVSSVLSGALNLGGSTPAAAPTTAASVAPVVVSSPVTTAPSVAPAAQKNVAPASVAAPPAVAAPAPVASADTSDNSSGLQFAAGPNGLNGAQPVENAKVAAVQNVASSAITTSAAAVTPAVSSAADQASEMSYVTDGNTVYAIQFATVNVYQTVDAAAPTAAAAKHRRHLHRHQARGHHA